MEEIWIQGGSRKNDIIWLYPSLFSMSVAWPGTGLRKLNKQAAVFYNSLCKKTYVTQKGESKLTSYFIAEGSCQAWEARVKGRKRLSGELLGVRMYCYRERKQNSRGVGLEQGSIAA